jgi:hypothetical protein
MHYIAPTPVELAGAKHVNSAVEAHLVVSGLYSLSCFSWRSSSHDLSARYATWQQQQQQQQVTAAAVGVSSSWQQQQQSAVAYAEVAMVQ